MACKRLAVQTRLAPCMSPSSSGLGHRPFTAATGVQIPLEMFVCGEVAEWSIAVVLKTIEDFIFPGFESLSLRFFAGIAQW